MAPFKCNHVTLGFKLFKQLSYTLCCHDCSLWNECPDGLFVKANFKIMRIRETSKERDESFTVFFQIHKLLIKSHSFSLKNKKILGVWTFSPLTAKFLYTVKCICNLKFFSL
ncbi:hypothetical protein EB796_014594 [Bugula neritina]|uniref:Uncharacterized protein n=1 Tax=Bugula neritina TaxID=10212 RepID=A0A7J7JNV5_BUGNE|nr:hypothetical protein EB796_014594 [Bugula neritina]